jgi:hypothetical protein
MHFLSDRLESGYNRLAKGFTELSDSLNPKTKEVTYIDDFVDTINTGYQTSWGVSGDFYDNDPANEMLFDMSNRLVRGEDAIVYMLVAYMWKKSENQENLYRGFRQECIWIPSASGGGTGGDSVTYAGNLNARGDRLFGWIRVASPHPPAVWETAMFYPTEEEPEPILP